MRRVLAIAACLTTLATAVLAQIKDLVPNDGISSPLHRANIGRIMFLAKPIPAQDYHERHFLKRFVLTEEGDLNILVYLGNSLTNHLHRLAPGMSAEELDKAGNYRFEFFVDGASVYAENLTPGAGELESKNRRTVFRVPFLSTTNEDSWGRFMWMRFLAGGGEESLTAGPHTLAIELRPYVKDGELKTGEVIASGSIVLDVVRPAFDEKEAEVRPIAPGSGWPVSERPFDRDGIRELKRRILGRFIKDVTSLVVVVDGKLLIEEYFNGAERRSLHDTRSVGKSFASTLLGQAIEDGHIKGVEATLREFYDLGAYANPSPVKAAVRLKDLLTMSSAFGGSDMDEASAGHEEKMYPTANWVKFALDLPMDPAKENGRQWDYFTAGVVVLGDILHKSVPGGLEEYADRRLFRPMGIEKHVWQYTPQKVVNTAGGLRLRSLDLAKYGQLYAGGGEYLGKRILPKAWVEATFRRYLEIPAGRPTFYGYLFWSTTYTVKGIARQAFYASGNGGNKIYVFPGQNLVVVVTATAYNQPYAHPQVDRMMERHVLPAVLR